LELRNSGAFIGKALDGLSLKNRWRLTGSWVATELYSPERLPLRIMDAIGASARDCIKQLQNRGLDPTRYHYELLPEPYDQ
jgi:hypothetical protein